GVGHGHGDRDSCGYAGSGLRHVHAGHRTSDRVSGGLGIGLTLVRSICVRLPPSQQNSPQAERETSPSAEAAVTKRVLIADDNLDAAESLQLWLQLAGHEVQIAGNGVTALKVAEEFKPDVALLDLG